MTPAEGNERCPDQRGQGQLARSSIRQQPLKWFASHVTMTNRLATLSIASAWQAFPPARGHWPHLSDAIAGAQVDARSGCIHDPLRVSVYRAQSN